MLYHYIHLLFVFIQPFLWIVAPICKVTLELYVKNIAEKQVSSSSALVNEQGFKMLLEHMTKVYI